MGSVGYWSRARVVSWPHKEEGGERNDRWVGGVQGVCVCVCVCVCARARGAGRTSLDVLPLCEPTPSIFFTMSIPSVTMPKTT
jgi:hypothetical protein